MKRAFNINYSVSFRLSKVGAETINKYFNTDRYKPGDIYEDQLWLVMKIFGEAFIGMESPMWDCTIFFEDKDLTKTESIQAFEKKYDRR